MKWFYTGLFMEDGKTKITVCAHSAVEEERFLKNGFKAVGKAGKKISKRVGDYEGARGGRESNIKDI